MDLTPLLGFAAISLTLALTPGADWAYTIAAGLRPGSPAPSIAGLCAGYVVHTVLVAMGLGMLLAARPDLVSVLSIAGAGYLIWLGMMTTRGWRRAGFTGGAATLPSGESLDSAVRTPGPMVDFLKGLGTSGINPKALLLFAAVMPQFVRTGSPMPVVAQTTAMGLTHLAFTIVVYTLVAVAARRLLAAKPKRAQVVTLVSGVLMLGIGGALLAEQGLALIGTLA